MDITYVALLLLLPFFLVFVYAGWHEYGRFQREGSSNYGLTYDPETNTTFVGAIPDGEDGYDPEEFDPNDNVSDETTTDDTAPLEKDETPPADPDETEQDDQK